MGQILGMGYSAPDKTKSQTTVNLPPELQNFYKQQTQLASALRPRYEQMLGGAMMGDTSQVSQYAAPMAGTYQDTAGQAYVPMSGNYTSALGAYVPLAGGNYQSLAGAYTPLTGGNYQSALAAYAPLAGGTYRRAQEAYMPVTERFQSVANTFQPGVQAYTAPYAAQIQNAQQQIRRAMPSGGGQQAALGQATMQGAMQMGAARAQQAQRDIDARNALRQEDVRTSMGLGLEDVRNWQGLRLQDVQGDVSREERDRAQLANLLQQQWQQGISREERDQAQLGGLRQQDIQGGISREERDRAQLGGLRQQDVQGVNALMQHDLGQLAALRLADANARNQLAAGDVNNQNQMMQKLLQYYASIFGGYNPQTQAGSSQQSTTAGSVGVPGASFSSWGI